MIQILKMAFRDLGRNRRRSFFSALAVGGGLALLILMSSVLAGEMGSALESAINLQTGHIQIRAATYDENKSSLKWEDLVENPEEIASMIGKLDQVKAATPRLYASGFLSSASPIVDKPPSADLWEDQTDEGELGFTYAEADRLLYLLVDQRYSPQEAIEAGFDEKFVHAVTTRIRRNQFKRMLPPIAKISNRTIGYDFLYLRDWGT